MAEIPSPDQHHELATIPHREQLDEIEAARLQRINEGLALPVPDYPSTEALIQPTTSERTQKLGGALIKIGDSLPGDAPVDNSNLATANMMLDAYEAGQQASLPSADTIRSQINEAWENHDTQTNGFDAA